MNDFAAARRHSKQGRCPAASAVGSSRKKKLGVAVAPNFASAALERADAGDPAPRRPPPAAQPAIVAMQPPAAIPHQPAALGDGVKIAERIDTVLQRPV
jgi:hypothetical protein